MTRSAAPKATTGQAAIDAALAAGFEITRHLPDPRNGTYYHELTHVDGRQLAVKTSLGSARLVAFEGRNRSAWNTRTLAARSVPAARRMLAA